MDLTSEAIKTIQESGKLQIHEQNGLTYSDKALHFVPSYKYPNPLRVSTLSSLTDYIIHNFDGVLDDDNHYVIHIESPTRVNLLGHCDQEGERKHLVSAVADLPEIHLNKYIYREVFQIQLQSSFQNATKDNGVQDKAILKQVVSQVEAGTIMQYGDDGISQKATIHQGVSGKADILVPNPVTLAPYRTFIDLEKQPVSEFIFRMKDEDGSVCCGLWEADGGKWRIEAIRYIKEYIESTLFSVNSDIYEEFPVIG